MVVFYASSSDNGPQINIYETTEGINMLNRYIFFNFCNRMFSVLLMPLKWIAEVVLLFHTFSEIYSSLHYDLS